MSSSKDIQTKEENNQQQHIKHPSFTIQKIEDTIITTLTLSTQQSAQLDEFYILHRETGERYSFLAEKKNESTYSFTLSIRDFIRQHAHNHPKAHFEFYFSFRYLQDSDWIAKDEPLSLSLFESFDSIGLSQFEDQGNNIYPYFSRKTKGFCFTVNIPVRSIRYIYSSQIEQIDSQKNNTLVVDGKIVTTAIEINRIDAIMIGRKSGCKHIIHSNHQLEQVESGTHHYHYSYTLSVDLNLIAKELFISNVGDEDFDFYFEVYLNGLFDPTIVRVAGPHNLKSRKFFKDQPVAYGKSVYLFSPNFTEQYRGLSLAATKYGKDVYEYYKEIRPFSRIIKPFVSEQDIWIIGEKPLEARNNGWDFFCYLRKNHQEINAYYILDETSADYKKAAAFDEERILLFKSKKYIQFLLMAKVILTTEAPYYIYPTRNPLWFDSIGAKRVLLQNNVLGLESVKESLSFSTKLFKTDLFLVSSKIEKRYAIDTLGYPEQQVVLTGLARFDKLLFPVTDLKPTNQLLFFPADQEMGLHYQTEAIDRTAEHFMTILKQDDFKSFVKQYDLTVTVALPHAMIRYFEQFLALGCTVLLQEQANTLQLLKESNVFITDYSPLAFDFSFLTKPVCFFQPEVQGLDQEATQSVNESYSNELPGEITSNESDLIYQLNQLGESEFKMSHKNRQKADALLEYRDEHSNNRIYEAIMTKLIKK